MTTTAERNLEARLRSASRIEPDRLPRLKLVGADWAQRVEAGLLADLGAPAAVLYEGAVPFETPREGGPVPAMLMLAASPAWPQPALLTTDEGFAGLAAECLLGGDGAVPATGRAPTQLDRRFCRHVLERFLPAGTQALGQVMDAAFTVERFVAEDTAERLDALVRDGAVRFTQLSFRLVLGQCEAHVAVAIPDPVLALARRKLDHLPEPPAPSADESWAREIEEGLLDAEMVLTALLDERATTLGEIAGLRIGQTLVLDVGVDSAITVECEDQRLFRGRMGRSRDSYLVRIEEKIDPTEEFIDDILAD